MTNEHRPVVLAACALMLGCGGDHRLITTPDFTPDAGPADRVVGAVTLVGDIEQLITFNAASFLDGSVSGRFSVRGPEVLGTIRDFSGRIECFTITGTEVRIAGVIEQSDPPITEADRAVWIVQDNGSGTPNPPDQSTFVHRVRDVDAVLHCAGGTNPPLFPITSGNVEIVS
jgi:hypothetical protein